MRILITTLVFPFVLLATICRTALGDNLSNLEMVIQAGHLRTVRDLAYSTDGRYILSGSEDKTMKLWDALSGSLLRSFQCENVVDDVAFVPDGRRVISYDDTGGIVIWDRITGKKLNTIPTDRGQGKDLFVLSDGKRIVFGHGEDTVEIWDIDTPRRLKRFTNRCNINYSWMSLSVVADEKRMLTTCRDGTVKLWDMDTGSIYWSSRINKEELGGNASATIDMKYVLAGRSGGYPGYPPKKELMVFDLESGKLKISYDLKALIHNIVPLPDNRRAMIMLGPPLDGEVVLFDFLKGSTLRTYKNKCDTSSFAGDLMGATSDMRQFVVPDETANLRTWDIETGQTVHKLGGKGGGRISKIAAPNNQWLVSAASWDSNTYVWNVLTGSLLHTLKGSDRQWSTDVLFSPDGRHIVTQGFTNEYKGRNDFRVWNSKSGDLVKEIPIRKSENLISFLKDGYLLTGQDEILNIREIPSWKLIRSIPFKNGISSSRIVVSSDLSRFVSIGYNSTKIWDFQTGRFIRELKRHAVAAFFLDNNHLLTAHSSCYKRYPTDTCGIFELWDIDSGEALKTFIDFDNYKESKNVFTAAFSADGKTAASGTLTGDLDIWNTETGERLHHYIAHSGPINNICFLPSGRHVATGGDDGTVRIWNIDNGQSITMVAWDNEWIAYTPDGYFDASRKGGNLIAGVDGVQSYRVDQLAFRFNRPDILLERASVNNQELITHYKNLYQKRLKKFGLSEEDLKFAFNKAPDAKITNLKQEGNGADIKIEIKDSFSELVRYNVFVNDVPIFGVDGKPVSGTNATILESVELSSGRNKIEVSALNKLGIESLRDHRIVEHSNKFLGDLYFLGFGVSKHADSNLNLKYASKDALDLESVFKKAASGFKKVYTRVFSDEAVTVNAFKDAKNFLSAAGVHDTVVLFVAGHGIYDMKANPDYYFLTHNADLNRLEETAARFELIEDLLQNIKPRNKLFLLDTCHSGELDPGEELANSTLADKLRLVGRGIRKKHLGENNRTNIETALFDHDRYIYNDLFRRSGAIVLSSSRGAELSYESDEIQNGMFTSEVIRALSSSLADKNKDKSISTEELRDYVIREVAEKTNGLQNPTVDRDNLENAFVLPIVTKK